MAVHIIEQFLTSKHGDPGRCEDVIVATDDFAAVVDGATDITGALYEGVTGGLRGVYELSARCRLVVKM
jgi:hypothetical protein